MITDRPGGIRIAEFGFKKFAPPTIGAAGGFFSASLNRPGWAMP
jgi:hypothetical protein